MVKELVRGLGLSTEENLAKKALSESETKYLDPQERERAEIQALSNAFKEQIRREILDSMKAPRKV